MFAAVPESGLWHKCEVQERPLLRRLWGLSGHQSAVPNDAIYEYAPLFYFHNRLVLLNFRNIRSYRFFRILLG
jgi:hypothetical protein